MKPGPNIEEVLRSFVVTIDGPAGSGKSTTASLLARRLGLRYLDTGAMYRAVTLCALEHGIDPGNEAEVTKLAEDIDLAIDESSGTSAILLGGRNVESDIRAPAVSSAVSPVSRHEGVRRAMVRLQRRVAARGGVVAEGRDTGSVVFPYAHVKVFLVADVDTRARRRLEQLRTMGIAQEISDIRENIRSRDEMDAGRRFSPLVRPAGAVVVDTSRLTIEEQVDLVEREVRGEATRVGDLAAPKGERNPFAAMSGYYRVSHVLVRATFRVLFGLRITGENHLRFRENYIFASNHVSYADPLAVGCALSREVWFLAKKELFRNPLFGRLIRAYHAIPVDREEIERDTMKRVFEILGAGRSILMFPEGTRSRTGELRDLKPGLGFTACRTGVSVVPVLVRGTNRLSDCFLRRTRIEIRIGPPIRLRSENLSADRKNDYRVLTRMVQDELRMLNDEAAV